jgi:Family of unknown function (DUF5678)
MPEIIFEPVKFREPIPEPDYEPSAHWIKEHRAEYGGQWVALDKDRLIVHGNDADTVFAAAQQGGAYLPLVTYIEPADALPFIFWPCVGAPWVRIASSVQ